MPDYPFGYAPGLTPDQQALIQQQGYFPQPTMSLPSGVPNTQPQGYQNLTPAQVQTQQGLGYYTQDPNQPQSLWDKLKGTLGSPAMGDLMKSAQGVLPQHVPVTAPMPPSPYYGGFNYGMYKNPFVGRKPSIDPETALKIIMGQY